MLGPRASHIDVLRVLLSGPDIITWFPVTGHRATFRMAQLDIQELKETGGCSHSRPRSHSSSTTPPPGACTPFTHDVLSPEPASADSTLVPFP